MKVDILGCGVDMVDMAGALEKVETFINAGTPHHIITLNAEIIYRAQNEPKLKKVINSAHLVTPDGAGVVWASRRLGKPLRERVTGIDLTTELAGKASQKGWKLFLYGAAPGVADEAALNLKKKYPGLRIAGTSHGYRKPEEMPDLIAEIKKAKPHILLVALGAPRQEYWIREHLQEIGVPVCMGVGGSFDVLAGRVERAPVWAQKAGLEWAYRLVKQPSRFKRMLALPKFALKVINYNFKKR